MTVKEAYLRARLRAVAAMVLDGMRDTKTIAHEIGVTPRHARRLLKDARLWEEYVPLRDRWVLERMSELKAEALENVRRMRLHYGLNNE